MIIYSLMYGLLAVAIATLATADEEQATRSTKCQFGKPLRNQIEVEPIGGMCLRDMVVVLSKALRTITNEELGVTSFQEMLDKLEFANFSNSLDSRFESLANKLDAKLATYTTLLKDSNNIIEPILLKESQNIYPSKRLDLLQNRADTCSQIFDALGVNLKNPEWNNLHILPVSQPGTICGPPSLAHNIGPLLLSQCSRSKKVILLLENGAFMSEDDVTSAHATMKTVIHMLSETDYVTAIGIAGPNTMHCKEYGLPRATDINKLQLERHVDSLVHTLSNKSIDLDLKSLVANVTGEVVVIHLTNSLDDPSNAKGISETMASSKLVVHFRTILILSNQQPRINIKESSKNGSIITLPSQNELGYEIARLFAGLKCNKEDQKDYYLSEPYFELYSKAMQVSIGQITNTALLSLDVKLMDFLEDVSYFNAGPNTHAVLFDKTEIVWMHKNFPRLSMMNEQPFKVYLSDVEKLSSDIISVMINQSDGILDVESTTGIRKKIRWRHLKYQDLIISVFTDPVIEDSLPVVKIVPSLPTNILHHRLDLMLHSLIAKENLCSYNNYRIATLETGVVYLSPWCFQSPAEQSKLLESGSAMTIQSYMAYIKDGTGLLANPGLQPLVRQDVATLSQILEHFKHRHTSSYLSKFVVQRYVVSVISGVLEVYPGVVLDAGLDPKRRAWYRKALENPGRIVLTPPYLDVGGAGYVVTLSHTVYEGKSAALHSSSDPILAVMSMDVTMGYISRILSEMFPFCSESSVKCFLMDDKGYLVFHPSLLEPSSKVEQQHLTHKELLVANDILNHELFVKKKHCANFLDGTVQRFYQFNVSLDEVLTNIVHGEHCVKYQLSAVPGTNVFLGVVNTTCNLRAFCPCSTMDSSCLNCERMEQRECECPCECSLYSNECAQKSALRENGTGRWNLEACPPPAEGPIFSPVWMQPAQPVSLQPCQLFNCKAYTNQNDCLGIVGCQWCRIDSDRVSPLQTPFCSELPLCFKGIYGAPIPYGDGIYNSQSTEEMMGREWPSVGPVAGGILAFVLILGITLFCYRLRTVQSSLEHQCLHLHGSPACDSLRMTHLDGEPENPGDLDPVKNHLDSALLRDAVTVAAAPISPYRVSTNYRRPPGGDSDHGYSTMTPHEDSEQFAFAEPLLLLGGCNQETSDEIRDEQLADFQATNTTSVVQTSLTGPHRVLVPVTVHRNMETNYC